MKNLWHFPSSGSGLLHAVAMESSWGRKARCELEILARLPGKEKGRTIM